MIGVMIMWKYSWLVSWLCDYILDSDIMMVW